PLFHRIGKRMVPTAAGEQLLQSATHVLEIVGRTEDGIRRTAAGSEGPLRISTQCYTGYHWLPSLLKAYRAAHPAVDVHVDAAATPNPIQLVQLTEAIIELVKAGLGVGVMARWAVDPYVRAGAIRAMRLTRKGYRREWAAVVLRDMAEVQYVKDFIELLATQSPVSK